MNMTRLIILGIAVIAGGAAFFLVLTNKPAPQIVEQVVPQASQAPKTVRVLVADKLIPQGAVLDLELTKWVKWPEGAVPEFYVTEGNEAFVAGLGDRRARRAIRPNEPIGEENTVTHGDRGMMAALLTPGMRAVSARFSEEEISGGFILPGDRVDIFASGVDASSPTAERVSSVLLGNVRVLAVDQVYAAAEGQNSILGRTLTFEVTPEQVRRFLEARDSMNLTLVLRSLFETADPLQTEEPAPEEVVVIRFGQG